MLNRRFNVYIARSSKHKKMPTKIDIFCSSYFFIRHRRCCSQHAYSKFFCNSNITFLYFSFTSLRLYPNSRKTNKDTPISVLLKQLSSFKNVIISLTLFNRTALSCNSNSSYKAWAFNLISSNIVINSFHKTFLSGTTFFIWAYIH